jgi:dipeptidyl aminopeptidase/acylaminoacyl peptidase
VVDPELFKAVVAIAPVTDLSMLRAESNGFTNRRIVQDYIGEGPQLMEGSPARQASKFKAPVMMFHGENDINVGVAESRFMNEQLKKAGKSSQLIIYPGIDHQLGDSAVRIDMLGRADAFLRKAMEMK